MEDIRAVSYLVASDLLKRETGRWHVIVVLDSTSELNPFVEEHSFRHQVLRFDDIEGPTHGRRLVTSEQIDQAIAFANESKRLMVTCRAGQSRSVALAYVLACQYFGIPAATGMLNAKRHIPNRLLVRKAARSLGRPEIEDSFQAWYSSCVHIVLSDHYDEFVDEVDALEASGVVNLISIE